MTFPYKGREFGAQGREFGAQGREFGGKVGSLGCKLPTPISPETKINSGFLVKMTVRVGSLGSLKP